MSSPALKVYIDWDNDGSFATSGDDVTAKVTAAGVRWSRGRNADFTADSVGAATFALDNSTGAYSPDSNAKLVPGRPVLITSTYEGTDRAHFYGYIQRISPNAKDYTTTIEVYDPRDAMSRVSTTLPLLDRTHHEVRVAALNYFGAGWRNLLSFNPTFATNTTGWSAAGGTSPAITRSTGDYPPGVGVTTCGVLTNGTSGQVVLSAITLDADVAVGDTLHVSFWCKLVSGQNSGYVRFLDEGADEVTELYDYSNGNIWGGGGWVLKHYSMAVIKAAAGINLTIASGNNAGVAYELRVAALQVTHGTAWHPYSATGGSGLGCLYQNLIIDPSVELPVSAPYIPSRWSKGASSWSTAATYDPISAYNSETAFGQKSLLIYFSASAGSGCKYTGLSDYTRTLFAGNTYVFSLYMNANGYNRDITFGIGSLGTPADYAESTVSVTTSWAQYSVTWTPTSDHADVALFIKQTYAGGAADSVLVDGVAVYPGTEVFPFEPPFADFCSEPLYAVQNASSGSVKSILDALNAVTLTRHWIEASLTAPYWRYRTESVNEVKLREWSEAFTDGDFMDFTGLDIDANAVINVQSVTPGGYFIDDGGVVHANADANKVVSSLDTSVGLLGIREGTPITSSLLENKTGAIPDTAIQQALADNIIQFHATPHSRPTLTVSSRWPSQLVRELDDVIKVTFSRLGISALEYYIVKLDHLVTKGGAIWKTVYTLEERVVSAVLATPAKTALTMTIYTPVVTKTG
jgi:hypothetical protein